jgi:hypothetical protein
MKKDVPVSKVVYIVRELAGPDVELLGVFPSRRNAEIYKRQFANREGVGIVRYLFNHGLVRKRDTKFNRYPKKVWLDFGELEKMVEGG